MHTLQHATKAGGLHRTRKKKIRINQSCRIRLQQARQSAPPLPPFPSFPPLHAAIAVLPPSTRCYVTPAAEQQECFSRRRSCTAGNPASCISQSTLKLIPLYCFSYLLLSPRVEAGNLIKNEKQGLLVCVKWRSTATSTTVHHPYQYHHSQHHLQHHHPQL